MKMELSLLKQNIDDLKRTAGNKFCGPGTNFINGSCVASMRGCWKHVDMLGHL